MKRIGTVACGGAIAALLASAISARASTISVTATFDSPQISGHAASTQLTSNYNDGVRTLTTVNTIAGVYDFTVDHFTETGISPGIPLPMAEVKTGLGYVDGPGGNHVFEAVCIDFTHNVYYGQTATWTVDRLDNVTTPVNGVGITDKQMYAVAYLWNGFFANSLPLNVGENRYAVLQMAVWDIIYNGGGTSMSATTIPVVPTVSYSDAIDATEAATWAQTAADQVLHHHYSRSNVYALINTDLNTQSFNFAIVGGANVNTAVPVPLPASVGVGFGMLGGFGFLFAIRKRLNRRPRIAG